MNHSIDDSGRVFRLNTVKDFPFVIQNILRRLMRLRRYVS